MTTLKDVEDWNFDDGTGRRDLDGRQQRPRGAAHEVVEMKLCKASQQLTLNVLLTTVLSSTSGWHLIGVTTDNTYRYRVEAVINTDYPQLDGVKLMKICPTLH